MAVWTEDRCVRIRRATRRDLAAIAGLVGRSLPVRFGRRAVADRRDDVYVADEIGLGVVGVVGVAYRRSLSAGGVVAEVDPLLAAASTLGATLLDFVTARATARGCVRIVLTGSVPVTARPARPDDGWTATTVFVRSLVHRGDCPGAGVLGRTAREERRW